ncbi:MAG: hypothetical protein JWM41_2078 [Gemmatimonadetes bacterium]|nr:hypothetical protein [Gemmatimonadota bacterium]
MTPSDAAVHLGGSALGQHRHVCAFFNTPEEEYNVLLPFIREGMDHGERAFHVYDADRRGRHLRELRRAGIDVDAAQHAGQLEVRSPAETYLRHGRFNQDAMLALIHDVLEEGNDLGFPNTRVVAHAETVFDDWPGAMDFLQYEARLNFVLPLSRHAVICTYDASKIGAAIALDALRTHPVVIIGGVMHENPFFAPPGELLLELVGRTARLNPPALTPDDAHATTAHRTAK